MAEEDRKSSEDRSIDEEFDELRKNHENFVRPLPKVRDIKVNVFYHVADESRTKKKLIEMARSTRPFLAKEIWDLLDDFMTFMRNVGGIEGTNYRIVYDDFTKADLVKRLLFNRPLIFVGPNDNSKLRFDGFGAADGSESFHKVAKILNKPQDKIPYLKEYISYDENLLSSLVSMSTPTFYFSDGSVAKIGGSSPNPHIDSGVLCALVGARNQKHSFMENRFINPRHPKLWTDVHLSDRFWVEKVYPEAFPQGFIPTQEDIDRNPKMYEKIYVDGINVVYFEKRLMLSIVPFIKEAAARGREAGREIFCSVPPIGAGVWRSKVSAPTIHNLIVNGVLKFLDERFEQSELKFVRALALPKTNMAIYSAFKPSKNIKSISLNSNGTIATVTFAAPENHQIVIYNEIRYVAMLLPKEFEHCLSVAGYAWDGNSYPGNEYWDGNMGSFDPKAIYCSLLGQFQNPEVNTRMADAERIRVY